MKSMRRLCYGGEEACKAWEAAEIKHTYWIVMDNQVIALYKDREGLHPGNVISIMSKELSERMQEEARKRGELDDDE